MVRPYAVAGLLAAATCLAHRLLTPDLSRDLLSVLLAALGGVYVGGALRQASGLPLAVAGAVGCLGLAVAGLRGPGWILPAGFLAHGAWDWAHHAARRPVVGPWWPPFCAAFDWLVGGYLIAVWAVGEPA